MCLVTRIPIGVLPDRSYEVISEQLRAYPGIKSISIDISVTYSGAVRKELPHAKIVTDRFHLVYNLGQTLMKCLQRRFLWYKHDLGVTRRGEPQSIERPLSKQEKSQLGLYEKVMGTNTGSA